MISPIKIWRRQKDTSRILGKKGEVIAWTIIYVPGKEYKKNAPYAVVLVELEDREKTFGQLVDYHVGQLKRGQEVKAVIRRVKDVEREDIIPYGIKFKPIG